MKRLACFSWLLVAACSTVQWDKPGASAETVDADARACSTAAQAAPTLPRQEVSVSASGVLIPSSAPQVDADQRMQLAQRMDQCMRDKGYLLKPEQR